MIKANHNRWAKIVFDLYIERLLRKNFDSFLIINYLPKIDNEKAVICTPNHFSWWDGFLIFEIYKKYFPDRKFYILMLEDQLKRYHFFGKLGAYSIDLQNPRGHIETVNYTRKILADPESFVVIYPQGIIEPFEKKEIAIKEGLKKFSFNVQPTPNILPIAFKFQFFDKPKPDIYCRFGNQFDAGFLQNNFAEYRTNFIANITALEREALSGFSMDFIFEKKRK